MGEQLLEPKHLWSDPHILDIRLKEISLFIHLWTIAGGGRRN